MTLLGIDLDMAWRQHPAIVAVVCFATASAALAYVGIVSAAPLLFRALSGGGEDASAADQDQFHGGDSTDAAA